MTRYYMQDKGSLESRIIGARLRETNMGLLKTAKQVRRGKNRRQIARIFAWILGWLVIAIISGALWLGTGP